MKLSFQKQKMMLANFNARSELHGEEREPAGDLKLEASLPNDVLVEFHPALRSLLYYYDDQRGADLADQAKKDDPDYLPHLRMPSLGGPLKWNEEMAGAEVVISIPGTKTEIVLQDAKVNAFSLEPRDGGTVDISLRVQAHPDEKQCGKLCGLIQSEVEVSITPREDAE